ncbi:hypothetical protein [Dongia sp.]|uniref:hypothetical protein n=1 Tax=Dongia sp. TaxID=1977262 RepID=UPI0035ADD93F
MRRVILAAVVSIALSACMVEGEGVQNALWARLAAANLLAGSVAQGLASSIGTEDGQVALDPSRAALIAKSLDAVELSLDAAGDALRGGLPAVAAGQIGAAESQLDDLVPLLPAKADSTTGETE